MKTAISRQRLSDVHAKCHRSSLENARKIAKIDRAQSFRMLELAKTSRFYFAALRAIGE